MINKLAIIIVGEYRTWRKSSKYLLQNFNGWATQIDYYFVTWNKTQNMTVTSNDIVPYFVGVHNLVDFSIVDINEFHNPDNYYKKAYLSRIGARLKRDNEDRQNFLYDQVIEVRPDIFYKSNKTFNNLISEFAPIKNNEFWNFIAPTNDINTGLSTVDDTYQRTTSATHNLISERVDDSEYTTLAKFLSKHNIIIKTHMDFLFRVPIRPTHIDVRDLDTVSQQKLKDVAAQYNAHDKNKIERLAVMLVGQYRTFAITHKYLFEFFKNKANRVDYYFVTWPTSGGANTRHYEELVHITDDDIVKYFVNENLVRYKIVSDIPKKHTYYRMAYLSNVAMNLKNEFQNSYHFVYDQVVETRPDIYLRSHKQSELWQYCEPMQYGGHRIETINGHLFTNDCYIRTDSTTYDLVSARIHVFDKEEMYRPRLSYGEKYEYDHHGRFADWLLTNNIKNINITDYITINVVRDPKLKDVDLNLLSADELHGISHIYTESRPRPEFITVYYNTPSTEFSVTHNIFIELQGDSLFGTLKWASLQIDKICYFNQQHYDWVRFIQNNEDNPDDFFKILPYVSLDTIYCTSDTFSESNFYCHPELFSLLGNVYKLKERFPDRTDEFTLMDLFVRCNIRIEKIC